MAKNIHSCIHNLKKKEKKERGSNHVLNSNSYSSLYLSIPSIPCSLFSIPPITLWSLIMGSCRNYEPGGMGSMCSVVSDAVPVNTPCLWLWLLWGSWILKTSCWHNTKTININNQNETCETFFCCCIKQVMFYIRGTLCENCQLFPTTNQWVPFLSSQPHLNWNIPSVQVGTGWVQQDFVVYKILT